MQRTSNKIGALAAALAKAQSEIANPEKSLMATVQSPFPREGSRTFKYAPLAAGLEIVRKCLGQHEIATVQATALDQETGLIKLTTTLVHSSGEWMSSDWPVCPISETAAPHRMGAALTYARRYGLFTLVGIAGEDDLDAPDLPTGDSEAGTVAPDAQVARNANGGRPAGHGNGRTKPGAWTSTRQIRSPEASAAARDRMLTEVSGLSSSDELDQWAYRWLPEKNTLTQSDAQRVDAAFTAKVAERQFGTSAAETADEVAQSTDKRDLEFPKARRIRDKAHLRFVAKQPCVVCGRLPSDPHHLRFAQPRGLGLKASDEFTVPLCRVHHRELHRAGKEVEWWSKLGIEPINVARELWLTTHPLGGSHEVAQTDQPRNEAIFARPQA